MNKSEILIIVIGILLVVGVLIIPSKAELLQPNLPTMWDCIKIRMSKSGK